ncbi:SRPBCC family protein [Roseobacter sp. HKCCA0434]|uniref:SRPBCC family protein n=1 Tax=Roseobacter sp. HKCCA0434 TaxID=3079297 RepID=UPI002905F2C8|nr:SRPBCC family protein [Roseobacter sp. HKCCA0434]
MAGIVHIEHQYDASADAVWALAKDFDALIQMSAGSVKYRGLPDTAGLTEGDVIEFEVSPFGLLPWQPYRVEMLEVDDAARRFVSLESGAGVKSWRHTLTVVPEGEGCRQTDHVEIDAGAMTWPTTLAARRMYRRRDIARRRLLGLT